MRIKVGDFPEEQAEVIEESEVYTEIDGKDISEIALEMKSRNFDPIRTDSEMLSGYDDQTTAARTANKPLG